MPWLRRLMLPAAWLTPGLACAIIGCAPLDEELYSNYVSSACPLPAHREPVFVCTWAVNTGPTYVAGTGTGDASGLPAPLPAQVQQCPALTAPAASVSTPPQAAPGVAVPEAATAPLVTKVGWFPPAGGLRAPDAGGAPAIRHGTAAGAYADGRELLIRARQALQDGDTDEALRLAELAIRAGARREGAAIMHDALATVAYRRALEAGQP